MSAHPYSGAQVAFATMHGKEQLARQPFLDILNAEVVAPPALDTDQFGTFSGEIARTLAPQAAARVKARLGMKLSGTPYGLASEGSFGAGLGYVVEHREVLMFIDEARGLELVESAIDTSPLPSGRGIESIEGALGYAADLGYPRQGVVLSTRSGLIRKGMETEDELTHAVGQLRERAGGLPIAISPDYRAHRCPSRAAVIVSLADRIARRLATPCPGCSAPGFGQVAYERGLRCSGCGEQTRMIAADILGCGVCSRRVRQSRAQRFASAELCDFCNP
jgi:hypothetical protein